MGGRGSDSGFRAGGGVTQEQQTIMKRFEKKYPNLGYTKPTFKKQNDGFIAFEYSKTRVVTHVHGGKMQSPDKNDIYERTQTYRGKIGKDGLILRGDSTSVDKLINRGKRR
jgi:hypothetical protein